ncbi:Dihydromethanopterin reductase (acceptor) [Candidatus Gugararchaeum adminiculabundum]|nr:Dihydromethanopterin reductase (acceptor) [Candidatus Gugararchaeum adminiculabundum]
MAKVVWEWLTMAEEKEKIAWCMTGSGHFLKESVDVLEKSARKFKVLLFLSSASEEILKIYGLAGRVEKLGLKTIREKEQGKSFPAIGAMYGHDYKLAVVAPATANTVAKIRWGVSDSLVTGVVEQAQKNRIPVAIMPCDLKAEQETTLPDGTRAKIYPTEIDLENVAELRNGKRKYLQVVSGPDELAKRVLEGI